MVSSIHAPALYTLIRAGFHEPISRLMKSLANNRGTANAVVVKRTAYLEGAWKELRVPLETWREFCAGNTEGTQPLINLIRRRGPFNIGEAR